MNPLYTATATANHGRDGRAVSSDGNLDVALSLPKGLGGPETPGTTNPEQMFAAGYAACFGSALNLVGSQAKANVAGSTVTAEVAIGMTGGGAFGLAVKLHVELPNVPQAEAEALTARAHEVCPYSSATRGNIDVELSTTGAPAA